MTERRARPSNRRPAAVRSGRRRREPGAVVVLEREQDVVNLLHIARLLDVRDLAAAAV
jgi:hypothetical protein